MRRSLRFRPSFTPLEDRSVPATLTWLGTIGSSWGTASNWSTNSLPVSGDDLVFPASAVNQTSNNNLGVGSLALNSISFPSGTTFYTISGNAFAVSTITDSSTNSLNSITADIFNPTGTTVNVVNAGPIAFSLTGAISGTGTLVKTGLGDLELGGSTANTYLGATTVSAGGLLLFKTGGVVAVPAALTVASGADALFFQDNQIAPAAAVTVGGTLDLDNFSNTIGPLTLDGGTVKSTAVGQINMGNNITTLANPNSAGIAGRLNLNGGDRLFTVADGAASVDLLVSAVVSGPFSAIKQGPGAMSLTANNTAGTAVPKVGTLVIQGNQPAMTVVNQGGTVGGTGTVGSLSIALGTGAVIEPGALLGIGGFPARLKTGNLVGNGGAASTVRFRVENGTLGGLSDEIVVTGTVNLAGMTLQTLAGLNIAPAATQPIFLIDNDASDAVVGTFVGLPQGAAITVNGQLFNISYTGGTGNDVVLIPAPRVSINSVSQLENAGNMVFTVSLSAASAFPVTVNFATSTGGAIPATADADFTTTSGTLTFGPGQTTQTVTVAVTNETFFEADQTFLVTLSSPTNANLGTSVGTGTIRNDDASLVVSVADVSILEGDAGQKEIVFLFSFSGLSELSVFLEFTTRDGSARLDDRDYITKGIGTFFVPPSDDASGINDLRLSISVPSDTKVESDETFFLDLLKSVGVTFAKPFATGTILNDDGPPKNRTLLLGETIALVGHGSRPEVAIRNAVDSEFTTIPLDGLFGSTYASGLRTATGDFNRDGIADYVLGTGPGIASRVVVISGKGGGTLFDIAPFEGAFLGGIFVAAGDINGDGIPEVIVTPDEGGGPRVQVYTGKDFGKILDFFGIADANFRGGARPAVGDIDGDGFADLVVAAGFGGGPRLATFSGKKLSQGTTITPENLETFKLFADFFAFESTLVNGTFVAVGDITGDGKSDIVVGGGPGGGPRVSVFNGASLLDGALPTEANPDRSRDINFFAGSSKNRNGVRLAIKNLDVATRQADLITGEGSTKDPVSGRITGGSQVRTYRGSDLTAFPPKLAPEDFAVEGFPGVVVSEITVTPSEKFDLFGGTSLGVFVG